MIALQDWMAIPLAQALGWALFHFLWQGAAAAVLLAAALWVCRTARTRYLLACAAMALMAVSFVATLAVCWPTGLPVHKISARASAAALPLPPRPDPTTASGLDGLRESGPPAWLVPVWLGGVSSFYAYSLLAWIAAARLKKRGAFPAPLQWQQRLQHLAAAMGVRGVVGLMESCLTQVPVVFGYLRPVILLPLGMLAGLRAEEVEAILIHELAHIRRYDYLVNVMQTLVEGLLFYHPAVWWTGRVMRAEREHCCDDMVVSLQGDARGYAATLARLELNRAIVRQPVLAATGGNLMRRIHRLMRQPEGPRVAAPLISAGILLAVAAVAVAAWQTQPQTQPQTAPPRHLVEPLPQRSVEPIPQTVPARKGGPAAPDSLATPYRKWLNEDAAYIIRDAERATYLGLLTDADREKFIEQFWLQRDPTPNTPENEYKQEHYRRIAYANEHFSDKNGLPGWKTDRGRIYITYGPPDEIEDHSAGGVYSQPPAEGGGTISTYPFQQWRYRFIQEIGNNVIIEFVDPTMTGEFRMTMDPTEKDALRYVPQNGAAAVSIAQVAVSDNTVLVTITANLAGGTHPTDVFGRITTAGKTPVSSFEERLQRGDGVYQKSVPLVPGSYTLQFVVRDNVTGVIATTDKPLVVDSPDKVAPLPLAVSSNVLPLSPASPEQARKVAFSIPIDTLGHKTQVQGTITTLDGRMVGNIVDLANGLNSSYQSTFTLPPGSYRAVFTAWDRVTGTKYQGENVFVVQ